MMCSTMQNFLFPGAGRGPVGDVAETAPALLHFHLPDWAPAFAGEQFARNTISS